MGNRNSGSAEDDREHEDEDSKHATETSSHASTPARAPVEYKTPAAKPAPASDDIESAQAKRSTPVFSFDSWDDFAKSTCWTEQERRACQSACDRVVRAVHKIGVAEVIHKGSSAKGTCARGRMEIDLLMLFNDFTPNKQCQWRLMKQIANAVRSNLPTHENLKHFGPFVLNFSLDNISVDITIAKQTLEPRQLLQYSRDVRRFLRFAVSKHQREFVISRNAMCKDVIRMAKWWRDNRVDFYRERVNQAIRPKSYLIELLVIRAYETVEAAGKPAHASVFRAFLGLVLQSDMTIFWEAHYKQSEIEWPNKEFAWRVVDPANPTAIVDCHWRAIAAMQKAAQRDWRCLYA